MQCIVMHCTNFLCYESECNGDRAGIYCICIVKHSAWCQCNGAKAALILPAVILITKQLLSDLTRDDADTGYWRQNLE